MAINQNFFYKYSVGTIQMIYTLLFNILQMNRDIYCIKMVYIFSLINLNIRGAMFQNVAKHSWHVDDSATGPPSRQKKYQGTKTTDGHGMSTAVRLPRHFPRWRQASPVPMPYQHPFYPVISYLYNFVLLWTCSFQSLHHHNA